MTFPSRPGMNAAEGLNRGTSSVRMHKAGEGHSILGSALCLAEGVSAHDGDCLTLREPKRVGHVVEGWVDACMHAQV